MPPHHDDHDEQDQQNHDDCQDCQRERAQNQKFIAIYQKLQQVDKRTSEVKGSIVIHQQETEKNKEVVKGMDQKVEQAKKIKNQHGVLQFEQFGYHLYAESIENAKKSEAQKENERLKAMLKKIYEESSSHVKQLDSTMSVEKPKPSIQTPGTLPPLLVKESTQWFEKGSQSSRTQSRTIKSFQQTSMDKSFEIFSTKSSFNMTKRKTFEKKDFQELNLWLFEQRNQILEKELYEARPKQLSNVNEMNNNGGNKHTSLNKGVQRYINMARNATRLGNSTVLRNSVKRQTSLIKKGMTESLNTSMIVDNPQKNNSKIHTIKPVQPEHIANSNRILNRRAYKGSVLPAISSK